MVTNAKRKKGVRRLPVALEVAGQQFPFTLCHRELDLGLGTIQYFWMDTRHLRPLRGEGIQNFSSCLGLWWWMTMQRGLDADPFQQDTLLLATSYQLVSNAKSMQHIYLDAQLGRSLNADSTAQNDNEPPNIAALPDEDRKRINEVVASRNRHRIKAEFDQALGLFFEPDTERYSLTWMCESFLARGRELLHDQAMEGVNIFVDSLGRYLAKWRRRGKADFEHRFIDMLSYECKVGFYRTYANAWRSLIPWLEKHEGLDVLSKRFLRLWHWQNQPIEVALPAGDPYAPARRRDPRVAEPGIDYVPDVFSGQVLSLHPLSGIIMKDPGPLSSVGSYVDSEQFDRVMDTGRADDCPAYWDFLEVVLTAANIYRLVRDQSLEKRTHHVSHSGASEVSVAENGPSDSQILNDLAAGRGWRCACGGHLEVLGHSVSLDSNVTLEYRCTSCGQTRSFDLDEEQLTRHLADSLRGS